MKEKQGQLQRESQKAEISFLSALAAPEALLPKDLELISCQGRSLKHGADGCKFFDESGGVRNCSVES